MYFNADISNFLVPIWAAVSAIAAIMFVMYCRENLVTRFLLPGAGINALYLCVFLLLQGHGMVINNYIVYIVADLLPVIGSVLIIIGFAIQAYIDRKARRSLPTLPVDK